jgi:hypothetical protein
MLKSVTLLRVCGCGYCEIVMKNVIKSWMLQPDVILKYRTLYACVGQVASGKRGNKRTGK